MKPMIHGVVVHDVDRVADLHYEHRVVRVPRATAGAALDVEIDRISGEGRRSDGEKCNARENEFQSVLLAYFCGGSRYETRSKTQICFA
jgi:hypothetical protein